MLATIFRFIPWIWAIFLVLFISITTTVLCDWFSKSAHKKITKIVICAITIITFFAMLFSMIFGLTSNNYKKEQLVSVIELSEVYDDDNEDTNTYYIKTQGSEQIILLNPDKVSPGSSDYVIKKVYDNGDISYELVLRNKNSVKKMKTLD